MRLLVVHNQYIHTGGEEACIDREIAALRSSGFDVHEFRISSTSGLGPKLAAALAPFGQAHEKILERELDRLKPDVLHAHNLFPLLSPRIFKAARLRGIRTVMTLHNFRPLCLNGLFLTPSMEVCERCPTEGTYSPGIRRGCYRDSKVQSLGLAAHLRYAVQEGWYKDVDLFIAPSSFLRNKFISYGFPADKITVQGHFLPNFTSDKPSAPEPYVLYLGRLSEEKGVRWLLDTFKNPTMPITLRLAGDGPLKTSVQAAGGKFISYLGVLSGAQKEKQLCQATALVLASECYENFPLAVIEANAWGTPALVSDHGGLSEIVAEKINGRAFRPHDAASFWETLQALSAQKDNLSQRQNCQDFARRRYSKETFISARTALLERLATSPR